MKITMYELYGKIYDETQPKHIRVYGDDWYWNDYDGYVTKESLKTTPDAQIYLMDRYRTFMNLDKEVEIIEENKIPEKIEYYDDSIAWVIDGIGQLSNVDKVIIDKLNEVLDYLKSKGDE